MPTKTRKSTAAKPKRSHAYDAIATKGKRRPVPPLLRSEDHELTREERAKLTALQRDVQRNFAIAAWMIRRHLDYVTTFSFQAKTGNEALDDRLEYLVNRWSKPESCDITGRHPLRRIIRLAEARRCVDNDCGLLKLSTGHIQAIEGDRIRSPYGYDPTIVHGVQINDAGKPLAYAVCRRGEGANAFVLERMVPAKSLYLHAHYDRFDQVRGVSPLAAGLNTLRDTYEGFDLALAKARVSQLFGLSIYRDAAESAGFVQEDEDGTGYSVDFGKGPILLELSPGDRAEFLESKSPAVEQQQFFQTMIQVALKSLDIPYSFYAENYTNYSGARQAFLQYEQAADVKRADIRDLLDHLTAWRLGLYLQDGELPGVTPEQLRWEWVHRGLPWLDPLSEIQAEIQAIDAGLDNPEDIAQRHGKDFYSNIDKIAACRAYAESRGVPLSTISTMTFSESVHETR